MIDKNGNTLSTNDTVIILECPPENLNIDIDCIGHSATFLTECFECDTPCALIKSHVGYKSIWHYKPEFLIKIDANVSEEFKELKNSFMEQSLQFAKLLTNIDILIDERDRLLNLVNIDLARKTLEQEVELNKLRSAIAQHRNSLSTCKSDDENIKIDETLWSNIEEPEPKSKAKLSILDELEILSCKLTLIGTLESIHDACVVHKAQNRITQLIEAINSHRLCMNSCCDHSDLDYYVKDTVNPDEQVLVKYKCDSSDADERLYKVLKEEKE